MLKKYLFIGVVDALLRSGSNQKVLLVCEIKFGGSQEASRCQLLAAMYRCRSEYGLMPLGMLVTGSALFNLYLIGLNYYGNTIEVLSCNKAVHSCDVRNFYVTDFSSILKMFEYLNEHITALEKESNARLPVQEPLSFARLVQIHGRFQLQQN